MASSSPASSRSTTNTCSTSPTAWPTSPASAQTLYPFAYVAREGVPKEQTSWVLHQGFVGVANGSETDANYSDFKDAGTPPKTFSSTGGWVGITDKYWMASGHPAPEPEFRRLL